MKRAAIYSALFHVVILVLLTIGFFDPFRRTITLDQPMIIDFVSIAELSAAPEIAPIQNTQAEIKPEPKPEPEAAKPIPQPQPPEPTPPPPPPPQAEQPTPPAPEPEALPIPDPLAKPEPPKKKEEPKPKPVEKTEQKPKKEEEPTKKTMDLTLEKKKAVEKKDNEKVKKKVEDDFSKLMNDIKKDDSGSAPAKGKGAPADRIGPVLTASEVDAILQRIQRCWLVPAGARGVKDMVVDIEMNIAPDGTVTSASIVDRSRMSDPFYRAAAESAYRAVLDPRCNPLPIPKEKYEKYKNLTLGFNPKDM